MNKKGQLITGTLTAGMIGFVVLAIFLILAFAFGLVAFLTNNIFTILGGAIIILTLIFGLPILKTRSSPTIIGVLASLIVVGLMLLAVPFISTAMGFSIGGSGDFIKPDWARLECIPTDSYEGTNSLYLDQTEIFACNGFTEECEYILENTDFGFWGRMATGNYRECDVNGGSCGSSTTYDLNPGEKKTLPKINSGRSYKINNFFNPVGNNEDDTKVSWKWKPWQLVRLGGGKWIVNSDNCDLSSSERSVLRSEDYVPRLYKSGGEGMKWINYVNDWNYGPGTNIFNHDNYGEVYCNAGQIFDIVELRMADGSLKKIDPTYVGELKKDNNQVETLRGMGQRLSYVECCPNEPSCTNDFEYVQQDSEEISDKECFSDVECYNAGGFVPLSQTSYATYGCESSKCVMSAPVFVECTSSAQCSNGQICDLSTLTYGTCIDQTNKDYCGDGLCQITESTDSCSADCKNLEATNCVARGGEWKPGKVTTSGRGWLGIGKLVGLTDETTSPGQCLISHISIFAIILILLGLILIIFSIIKSMPLGILPGSLIAILGIVWSIMAGMGYA